VRTKLSFLFIACLFAFGCKKENVDSKPRLTLKDFRTYSVNTNNGNGNIVEIDLEVSDKEGDIRDSIFITKIILDPSNCIDTLRLKHRIPVFPSGNTDNILFQLKFASFGVPGFNGDQVLPGRCSNKDLTTFKICVQDLAGNRSDTISTPPVIIQ
jgi:hypothetical protein